MEIIKQINDSCGHHRSKHSNDHLGKDSFPPDGITSNFHDGALVCSGNRHITGDPELIKKNMEKEIGLLDTWVEEQEGLTGHIKAIISVNGPVCRISATGGKVESKNLQPKGVHVSIVAIVFQTEQKIMEQRIESLFDKLITKE